jgi:hypothetical protein
MRAAPPQVYAGVDWLSLTTGLGPDADHAYDKARALATESVADGNKLTPWSLNGWKGFAVPHLRCAAKEGDVRLEISGEMSQRYWREFVPLAQHISRCDTCVDVTHDPPRTGLAQQAFDAPGVSTGRGHPPVEKRFWISTKGASTCYVGSPKSRRMGRLYDKTAESGGEFPEGTWRYELQERDDVGDFTARSLHSRDDVHRAIAAYVYGYYSRRGVQPWFRADGSTLPSQPRKPRSDMQRRLGWYSSQIRPGVRDAVRAGHRRAVLEALGLDADGRLL